MLIKRLKLQQGIVLIVTLIYLLVLSSLAVSALTISHLQLRMSQNYEVKIQAFEAAEAGLHAGEQVLKPSFHAAYLQKETGSFHYENFLVSYYIEKLPGQVCLLPMNKTGDFYQITAFSKRFNELQITLQSTYAAPTQNDCSDHEKNIYFGRLSWNQLK